MKIKSFQYIKKTLPLTQPLFLNGKVCNSRDVYLIKIENIYNVSGVGEAVLLESHGTENEEELIRGLDYLSKNIFDLNFSDNIFDNERILFSIDYLPALRNAIEQALLNIYLQYENNIESLIKRDLSNSILLNATIFGKNKSDIFDSINNLLKKQFNVFKVKVGKNSVKEDLKLVKKILLKFPGIKLRLDPNCSWDFSEAEKHIKDIENLNIDYIEQPFTDTQMLLDFSKKTSIKIAADESANEFKNIKQIIDEGIKIIILKPMVSGGILNCLKIIDYAESKNVEVIISSSIESNIGIQIPIILAASLDSKNHHGLNTALLFEKNFETKKWIKSNNNLALVNINNPITDFYG